MADRPDVTVQHQPDRQRYEAIVDGTVAGHIEYRLDGDVVDMQHTVVHDRWEGVGVGSALVSGALDQVRSAGQQLRPSCPFVRRYVEGHDGYTDLVA